MANSTEVKVSAKAIPPLRAGEIPQFTVGQDYNRRKIVDDPNSIKGLLLQA